LGEGILRIRAYNDASICSLGNESCGALPFKEKSGLNSDLNIFLIELPGFVEVTYFILFLMEDPILHTPDLSHNLSFVQCCTLVLIHL